MSPSQYGTSSCGVLSLYSLISSDKTYTCFPRYFFERDRLYLAIVLTCSVLGLHASPWFPDDWTSENIYFETSGDNILRAALMQPHVTATLLKIQMHRLRHGHYLMSVSDRCMLSEW